MFSLLVVVEWVEVRVSHHLQLSRRSLLFRVCGVVRPVVMLSQWWLLHPRWERVLLCTGRLW